MKVLFAVSNEEISESIVKKYQKEYKQIISYKNVYYFNAILKEIQKDKTYDRIVISEDLEAFTHTQYDQIDKFIFDKLDSISDEASNIKGNDIPIILICSDRRTKGEQMLVKLFGIGVYNAIIGSDRSIEEVCRLINRPRVKKEAKTYYKIDSEDVKYQPENENDVSEMEIQNIVAYYKRLGKDEDRYVESFDNNIASQYNDTQLRIISKFLPLNVRAVLEERSPKYQQIMSFNNSVSDKLRKPKDEEEGTSETLLKLKDKRTIMTNPVVIPSAVNLNTTKKLSRVKNKVTEQKEIEEPKSSKQAFPEEIEAIDSKQEIPSQDSKESEFVLPGFEDIEETKEQKVEEINSNNITEKPAENVKQEKQEVQPVKRGRGRPRKNNVEVVMTEQQAQPVKRGRGRPRKKPISEEVVEESKVEDSISLPKINQNTENLDILPGIEEKDSTFLPGFEEESTDTIVPEIEKNDNTTLPGLTEEDDDDIFSYNKLDDDQDQDNILPGIEENDEDTNRILKNNELKNSESNFWNSNRETSNEISNITSNNVSQNWNPMRNKQNNYEEENIDLSRFLTPDKKIVSFVGTSKNGTSFLINNIAEIMSSNGINTAILDTTQNRNSYYIYTKNEEELRNIAINSISGLKNGVANGISVNKNLTVYTALPDENDEINQVGKILETLVKNYSLILIDTDFDTSLNYFKYSQEIYLVQTLDILTIQPLTMFLRELKSRNILDENKLRIVLNKSVKLRGITEKTIIGGMAYYNDPAMSYMTELFDRNTIKYIAIPFDEEAYIKYLEGIINCDISIKGYSKGFIQILNNLANMVYPTPKTTNTYRPPNLENNGFTPSMNNTLERMKKRY